MKYIANITSTTTQRQIKGKPMLNQSLEQLSTILSNATQADIDAAGRMYSQGFRTEAYPLNQIEDWEELAYTLKIDLALAVYAKAKGITIPTFEVCNCFLKCGCSDSFGYDMEMLEDKAQGWFECNYPDVTVNGDTLIVTPCNYKGAPEEPELYILNKDLPIFESKAKSFYQANK
ncbi:MAG: hypothetical protein GY787_24265 [Alteromonadales bacterium]|nr:hypothetical protein [Alteromonadales bacterium]